MLPIPDGPRPALHFLPAARRPWMLAIGRWGSWLHLRLLGIRGVETAGGRHLVELYRRMQEGRARFIIAFRHPSTDDGPLVFRLMCGIARTEAARLGVRFARAPKGYFLYGRDVPEWGGHWLAWFFPRLGAISVFPEPVTPWRRQGEKSPEARQLRISSRASACSPFSAMTVRPFPISAVGAYPRQTPCSVMRTTPFFTSAPSVADAWGISPRSAATASTNASTDASTNVAPAASRAGSVAPTSSAAWTSVASNGRYPRASSARSSPSGRTNGVIRNSAGAQGAAEEERLGLPPDPPPSNPSVGGAAVHGAPLLLVLAFDKAMAPHRKRQALIEELKEPDVGKERRAHLVEESKQLEKEWIGALIDLRKSMDQCAILQEMLEK